MTDEQRSGHRAWLAAVGVLVVAVAVSTAVLVTRSGNESGRGSGTARPLPLVSSEQVGQAAGVSGVYHQLTTEYSLAGDLPELGDSGSVYQLRALTVTVPDVQRMAAAVGVGGEPQADDARRGWTVSDGQRFFNVQQSGPGTEFSYTRMETVSQAMTPPTALPSEAEAEQIARGLVANMGFDDGQTDWDVEVQSSGTRVAVACAVDSPCPTATSPSVDYERTVRLRRVVDGYPIDGLGVSLSIGDQGEIQGISGTAAELEPVADYPLMATRAAYDALVAGNAIQPGFAPMRQSFTTVGSAVASSDVGPGVEHSSPTSMAPETVNVTITGAERGEALVGAVEGGQFTAYLVPTYRFAGHSQYGELTVEVVAIDPSLLAVVDPASIPSSAQEEPVVGPVGSVGISDTTTLFVPPETSPPGG
jgi:hypothetical protein